MRGLLLLGIVGTAIYAVLIFTHDVITDGKTENTYAGQTQPDHPDANRLSSWDGYHPTPSVSQNPQVAMSQPAPDSSAKGRATSARHRGSICCIGE